MNVSFAPLRPDAVAYLSTSVGVDYTKNWPFTNTDRWFCVTARDDEGGIMGVILAEFFNWFDVHFDTAVGDRRCVTRRTLKAVFTALFSRAVRVTSIVDVDNTRAVKNILRMGFAYEGYGRLIIEGNRDGYLFGMLQSDCRFLPGYTGGATVTKEPDHGWHAKTS